MGNTRPPQIAPQTVLRHSHPPTSGRSGRWPRTRRRCRPSSWPPRQPPWWQRLSSCPAVHSSGHLCCRSGFSASPNLQWRIIRDTWQDKSAAILMNFPINCSMSYLVISFGKRIQWLFVLMTFRELWPQWCLISNIIPSPRPRPWK